MIGRLVEWATDPVVSAGWCFARMLAVVLVGEAACVALAFGMVKVLA